MRNPSRSTLSNWNASNSPSYLRYAKNKSWFDSKNLNKYGFNKLNSKNRVHFAILQVEAIIITIPTTILIITPRAYETNRAMETVAATKLWISPSTSKKPWTPSWNIPPILISSSTHTLSLQTVPRSAHCALILQQLLTTISIATMKILTTFMEIIVKPMIIN